MRVWRPSRGETIMLLLLTVLPFIIVNGILIRLSDGVHGTTYADYENTYQFNGTVDGEYYDDHSFPEKGTFEGNIYIESSTGWVFCNGKVRFTGPIHIKNAKVNFSIKENRHLHDSLFGNERDDYQEITLNGKKGEMKEGIPFWIFGLLTSCLGAMVWWIWYISSNTDKYFTVLYFPTILFAFYSVFGIFFTRVTLLHLPILIICGPFIFSSFMILCWIIWNTVKTQLYNGQFIFGFLILLLSIISITNPQFYTSDSIFEVENSIYSEGRAILSLYYGLIGITSGSIIMALSFGNICREKTLTMNGKAVYDLDR